jgi:nucleotide-binding universal stress UspA family protein
VYDSLLVPTDGSDGTAAVADHAFGLAAAHDATVTVLSVVDARERFGGWSTGEETAGRDRATAAAERTVADLAARAPPDVSVKEQTERGVPHEVIVEAVEELDADLVVMGTHGRTGVRRQLLGSVTERVLRYADAPVLAVGLGDGGDGDRTAGGG